MKKIIIPLLLIGIFILAGCGSKNAALSGSKEASSVSQSKGSNTSNTSAGNTSSSNEVSTQFKPVKPGTVPPLNQNQKAQVNNKLNSVVNNLDGTLKSLDDASDINFN